MTAKSNNSSRSNRSDKRRTNKPLMEKRRRARINQSLSILKSLIVNDETNGSNASLQSRLEKADILELTVMHLRTLEKQRDEYLQEQQELSDQRITIEKKNNPSVDSHVKSYKLGYQACCHDIGRFLDEPALHLTKERLIDYLNKRKEKTLQPSQENGDDPVVVNLITPTRLLDGRLALIFSSSCSWLTRETDLSTPSYTSSSSLSSLHSNSEPTTPPSSPDQKIVQRQLTADLNVWRPWF